MRKFLLSVFAVSILSVGQVPAQTVRVDGFGVHSDDITDYGNLYAFPQKTGLFANNFAIFGDATDVVGIGDAEVIYDWNDKVIFLGFYSGETSLGTSVDGLVFSELSEKASDRFTAGAFLGLNAGAAAILASAVQLDPDQKVNLGLSMPLGSGYVGLRISQAARKDNRNTKYSDSTDATTFGNDDDSMVNKASQLGINVGYGQEEVGPFSSVDLGVWLQTGSFEYSNTNRHIFSGATQADTITKIEDDGASDVGAKLRLVKDNSDDSSWIINAEFDSNKAKSVASWKFDGDADGSYTTTGVAADDDDSATYESKGSLLGIRLAYNKHVNEDAMGVFYVGLQTSTVTTNESISYFDSTTNKVDSGRVDIEIETKKLIVPVGVGFEIPVNEDQDVDVKIRWGVHKNWVVSENVDSNTGADYDAAADSLLDKSTTEDRDVADERVALNLGLGLSSGNFYLDAALTIDVQDVAGAGLEVGYAF